MNFFKKLLVVATLFMLFGNNVYAVTSSKEIGTCNEIYTNYYLFLEANTSSFFSNPVTKTNVGTFENSYFQVDFDTTNVGYGQVKIDTTTSTSDDNITSWSLEDYYRRLLMIGSDNSYKDGNITYFGHSKWYDEIQNTNNRVERSDHYDVSEKDINTLIKATVDAESEIERESLISNEPSEMNLKITRSYNGTGNATGIDSGDYTWYLQPQVYYVRYCKKDTVENKYKVSYDKNTTDNVTNMPEESSHNSNEDATLSNLIPEREGYRFLGWSTNILDNGNLYKPGEIYTDRKDITLYAIWQQDAEPTAPDNTVENPQTALRDNFIISAGIFGSTLSLLALVIKKGFLRQL